jgi:hypothetical protein
VTRPLRFCVHWLPSIGALSTGFNPFSFGLGPGVTSDDILQYLNETFFNVNQASNAWFGVETMRSYFEWRYLFETKRFVLQEWQAQDTTKNFIINLHNTGTDSSIFQFGTPTKV